MNIFWFLKKHIQYDIILKVKSKFVGKVNVMKNRDRIMYRCFLIISIISNIVGIINVICSNISIAVIFMCVGSTFLCLSSVLLSKNKDKKKDDNKKN